MPTKSESFLLLYSDWAPHILPTAGHARRCLRSRQTAPQPYCWQQPTSVWTPLSSSLKTRMKKLEPSRWGVRDMYFQENGDVKKSRLKFLTQYILISVFLQCCKQRGERSSVPNFEPSHKVYILRKRTLRLGAFVSWKLRNYDWGNNLFLLHWQIERSSLAHRLVESHIVDMGTNYGDDITKGLFVP